jgi:1-acyl-sn-glycerol-3-phosphate acyltransferase
MHDWMPSSPCGPDCVDTDMPTVGPVRTTLRLARVVGVLLGGVLTLPCLGLLGERGREVLARKIFLGVLHAVGARLVVRGDPTLGGPATGPGRGVLVVDNHVSWLDIVVVNAVRPMRSVAKREIASWPVVGPLAARAGTVFLDRERLRALPDTIAELTAALRAGALVNVCPEGTTWCGQALGRFRPALFQAAIDSRVPVRPVVVRYRLAGGATTTWPAFIGDETLVRSVFRTVRLRGLVAELHVLAEIATSAATSRHELAAATEAAVRTVLRGVLRPEDTALRHPVAA